jgi:hypothetical protein
MDILSLADYRNMYGAHCIFLFFSFSIFNPNLIDESISHSIVHALKFILTFTLSFTANPLCSEAFIYCPILHKPSLWK